MIGPDGDGIATGLLGLPLPEGSYTFTDYFSHDHPGRGRPHLGVDLAAPTGTPVYSADGGQVDLVGWGKKYGNFIVVGHSNGRATLYAHLSKVNVRQGQPVSGKHKIGEVGSTGLSTGPHLHFEVIEGYSLGDPYSGIQVNPEKYYQF
ncbi:M23 family metallopeptidase [Acaryochloris marina NIES-2412]|uniref:M23 family metallopeptidase n=1 Tax=Acaryochloris marina TaxID=155978 RepID=UPI004058EEB3